MFRSKQKAIDIVNEFTPPEGSIKHSFVKADKLQEINNISPTSHPLCYSLYSLKDLIYSDSWVSGGSSYLQQHLSPFKSTVFSLLRNVGSVHLVSSQLDEFGMGGHGIDSVDGIIKNPIDPTREIGGSSSGSVLLVWKDVVDFAITTDTGDSSRKPAAFVGIIGFKPSYGAISRWGTLPFSSSLDTVSIISKKISTISLVFETLNVKDAKDLTTNNRQLTLTKKKIGYFEWDEGIQEITNSISLELGYEVIPIQLDFKYNISLLYKVQSYSEAVSNYMALNGVLSYNEHHQRIRTYDPVASRKVFGNEFVYRNLLGIHFLKEGFYIEVKKIISLLNKKIKQLFETVDVIMSTTSNIPQLFSEIKDGLGTKTDELLLIANFCSLPAITIPWKQKNNLPIGLHLSSPQYTDKHLLDIAKKIHDLFN